MRGRISDASMTAILGTFAQGRRPSRVIFVRPESHRVERFELQISAGHAIGIHSNELLFGMWFNLLDNPYLEQHGLTAAFHSALSEDRKLASRVAPELHGALHQARGLTKRRALESLLDWRDGQFGSNAKVVAVHDPSSVAILRMLPRLVARQIDDGWLQAQLAPFLNKPLQRSPSFDVDVERLHLRKSERRRVEAFQDGATLLASLERANAGHRDTRYGHVLAYLLLELGLLR